jgi:hypothetical protein
MTLAVGAFSWPAQPGTCFIALSNAKSKQTFRISALVPPINHRWEQITVATRNLLGIYARDGIYSVFLSHWRECFPASRLVYEFRDIHDRRLRTVSGRQPSNGGARAPNDTRVAGGLSAIIEGTVPSIKVRSVTK